MRRLVLLLTSVCVFASSGPARADRCADQLGGTIEAASLGDEVEVAVLERTGGERPHRLALVSTGAVRGLRRRPRFPGPIDLGLAALAGTLAYLEPERGRQAAAGLVLVLIYRGLTYAVDRFADAANSRARADWTRVRTEESSTGSESALATITRYAAAEPDAPMIVLVPRAEFRATARLARAASYRVVWSHVHVIESAGEPPRLPAPLVTEVSVAEAPPRDVARVNTVHVPPRFPLIPPTPRPEATPTPFLAGPAVTSPGLGRRAWPRTVVPRVRLARRAAALLGAMLGTFVDGGLRPAPSRVAHHPIMMWADRPTPDAACETNARALAADARVAPATETAVGAQPTRFALSRWQPPVRDLNPPAARARRAPAVRKTIAKVKSGVRAKLKRVKNLVRTRRTSAR